MGTEQKNLDVPLKVTGKTVYGIDVRLPGMKWAAVKACPVYGGNVKSYDFERSATSPASAPRVQFPIPDPALTRGRVFSGGVAVIADTWYQAKTALDRMPIEWDCRPSTPHSTRRTCARRCWRPSTSPAKCASIRGTVDAAFARAAKIVEATYSTPYLAARAHGARQRHGARHRRSRGHLDRRSEPAGDALQRLEDHRHPRAERLSAHVPPRRRLRPQRQRPAGRAGDHDRQREPRHADPHAVDARGGLHRHDLSRDGRGAPEGRSRCRRLADRARSAHRHAGDGFGPDASFNVASRYYVPNYRYSTHTTEFHVPVGTRRGVGQAAHEFYRESFMDELAHAAGKDPYLYRRELISRTNLPYKADMIKALDMAAEMSGWGTPLPKGTARAIALEERGAEAGGHATISAMVHTVSVSREGKVRLERVDVAHEDGFGLVNPLSVKKQIEGQITWFYNDAMHQASNVADGRIVENNFDTFPLSRINEDPPEINIRFFPTGHWLHRHGSRPRHLGSIGDRRRDLPDHRQALPGPAVQQARSDLELRPLSGISEAISTFNRRAQPWRLQSRCRLPGSRQVRVKTASLKGRPHLIINRRLAVHQESVRLEALARRTATRFRTAERSRRHRQKTKEH